MLAVLPPPDAPPPPPPPPPPADTGVAGAVNSCLALAMLVAICMIPDANCAIPAAPAVTPFNALDCDAATKADIALAVSIPICTNALALLNLASFSWSLISIPPISVIPLVISLARVSLASLSAAASAILCVDASFSILVNAASCFVCSSCSII